jgi:enoyl-CoA hydratase
MPGSVGYERDHDVAHVVLDDGKVNVMSIDMIREIDEALDLAEREARLVVLRSARRDVFSAGFDLRVLAAEDPEQSIALLRAGAELALRLLCFPLPTLGVVQGHAFPMGAFLLLACDLRIGARGTHRMGLNEVAIGIVPPAFAIVLARSRLHPAWLHRTVALGEMYEPDEAREAGFLDRVVEPESVEATVRDAVASILATVHGSAHTAAKRSVRRDLTAAMRAAIDGELTVEAYRRRVRTSGSSPTDA